MLALALGGRTVAELRAALTESEFQAWIAFYRDFPFDDYHRFHRPAALVSTSMAGGDVQSRLNFLQPRDGGEMDSADSRTMKALLGGG